MKIIITPQPGASWFAPDRRTPKIPAMINCFTDAMPDPVQLKPSIMISLYRPTEIEVDPAGARILIMEIYAEITGATGIRAATRQGFAWADLRTGVVSRVVYPPRPPFQGVMDSQEMDLRIMTNLPKNGSSLAGPRDVNNFRMLSRHDEGIPEHSIHEFLSHTKIPYYATNGALTFGPTFFQLPEVFPFLLEDHVLWLFGQAVLLLGTEADPFDLFVATLQIYPVCTHYVENRYLQPNGTYTYADSYDEATIANAADCPDKTNLMLRVFRSLELMYHGPLERYPAPFQAMLRAAFEHRSLDAYAAHVKYGFTTGTDTSSHMAVLLVDLKHTGSAPGAFTFVDSIEMSRQTRTQPKDLRLVAAIDGLVHAHKSRYEVTASHTTELLYPGSDLTRDAVLVHIFSTRTRVLGRTGCYAAAPLTDGLQGVTLDDLLFGLRPVDWAYQAVPPEWKEWNDLARRFETPVPARAPIARPAPQPVASTAGLTSLFIDWQYYTDHKDWLDKAIARVPGVLRRQFILDADPNRGEAIYAVYQFSS